MTKTYVLNPKVHVILERDSVYLLSHEDGTFSVESLKGVRWKGIPTLDGALFIMEKETGKKLFQKDHLVASSEKPLRRNKWWTTDEFFIAVCVFVMLVVYFATPYIEQWSKTP